MESVAQANRVTRRLPFGARRVRLGAGPVLALLAITCSLAVHARLAAQSPPPDQMSTLCPPPLPILPAVKTLPDNRKTPQPQRGPLSELAEGVTATDTIVELLIGQGRVLVLKQDLAPKNFIAVGDPTIADFFVVNSRQIRVYGIRMGVTDLSITTADGKTYTFEVRVVADLHVLDGQLRCLFPSASLKVSQLRDHIVVEGQARDTAQVARIMQTVKAYLVSIADSQRKRIKESQDKGPVAPGGAPAPAAGGSTLPQPVYEPPHQPTVINLIHVPGAHQVLLKVRVAELNRTAMRQIGSDFLAVDKRSGALFGTQIGGSTVTGTATAMGASSTGGSSGGAANGIAFTSPTQAITGAATTAASAFTTAFGIFQNNGFDIYLSALRQNNLLKILAEPNLVALNGQHASFLAGGKFPVPIPQTVTGGAGTSVTVTFEPFGVDLEFVPYILDGDVIRLKLDESVSSIDTSLGTVLVPGGTPVPGLNTREAHTTVEMRQGETLAIAGLMQLTLDGTTTRIPVLGDLPIIGPFFSNTTGQRIEKELVVLVTPYLIEPMREGQVPAGPGDEVKEPNNLEFYLLGRIEGRTGRDHRSTVHYDDPAHLLRNFLHLEDQHVSGPHGFSD